VTFSLPPAPREPTAVQAEAEFAAELARSAKGIGCPLDAEASRLLLGMLHARVADWRAGGLMQARLRAHARKVVLWSVLRAAEARAVTVTGADFMLALADVEALRTSAVDFSVGGPPHRVGEAGDEGGAAAITAGWRAAPVPALHPDEKPSP